jgi:hypothetical protein
MNEPLSVEEVLEAVDALADKDVLVQGVLSFAFENVALYASLEDLRRLRLESSIWLSVGSGSLRFDQKVCEKLHGKPVVVAGTLLTPLPNVRGCGHFGAWPAEILARTLEAA